MKVESTRKREYKCKVKIDRIFMGTLDERQSHLNFAGMLGYNRWWKGERKAKRLYIGVCRKATFTEEVAWSMSRYWEYRNTKRR